MIISFAGSSRFVESFHGVHKLTSVHHQEYEHDTVSVSALRRHRAAHARVRYVVRLDLHPHDSGIRPRSPAAGARISREPDVAWTWAWVRRRERGRGGVDTHVGHILDSSEAPTA
jgi:hypothetical protein